MERNWLLNVFFGQTVIFDLQISLLDKGVLALVGESSPFYNICVDFRLLFFFLIKCFLWVPEFDLI